MSRGTAALAMLLPASILMGCGAPAGAPPATAAAPPSSAASPSSSASPAAGALGSGSDPSRLVGRWMRTDSEYLIGIESVSPDGKVNARYLNPQPINVSRAEVKNDEGRLRLLVELRDKGYPGSYYTLTYDPQGDALFGVYHHLGLNENFDVSFYRLARDKGPGQ